MEIEDAVEQIRTQIMASMWKTGTVIGTSGTKVVVTVEGGSMTLPALSTYVPTVADVVQIAARSGGWFVLGKVA